MAIEITRHHGAIRDHRPSGSHADRPRRRPACRVEATLTHTRAAARPIVFCRMTWAPARGPVSALADPEPHHVESFHREGRSTRRVALRHRTKLAQISRRPAPAARGSDLSASRNRLFAAPGQCAIPPCPTSPSEQPDSSPERASGCPHLASSDLCPDRSLRVPPQSPTTRRLSPSLRAFSRAPEVTW